MSCYSALYVFHMLCCSSLRATYSRPLESCWQEQGEESHTGVGEQRIYLGGGAVASGEDAQAGGRGTDV